ncbi:glucosaminidase domain-containing protein [Enterococcus hulanensis]|uniref:Glucosaminidase domain-containing protein n=1 Tax=Enterococcus hulanensis TaxID=2559929 RepID=A0ABU3F5X7_9ENTE|nr:glucosaminidase domain-containing protein [Enterococcus hulanensis]MDT2602518.1 glucosaminidase domain-containing protein [Enterococcus hulanensis]MDT2611913.1 glucosaminidase domain-containing protein [Enterococcus hulanensis]MDT2619013.1 glucosaminidase domain-containing protein [Enterococcus hulanensis]MDT2630590.1 glucosaminidase domain-containing protein [Enterococcus hulanensis]MDT2658002.1 glucosaminidase domain-containing protein [Enterococcus hulanensis]
MKKIMIGVCGVLVFIGGLVSIRSGVLKAGELPEESSLIVETGTMESAVSIPEGSETPVEEGIVPDTVEEVPVEDPEVPTVESTTSSETPTTSESTPSESSTVETSTSTSSTSSSASTSSSTKPTSSSSTSSTTKPSSTKPSNSSTSSSTKPSNTKPSNTKPSASTSSSSVPAQSSTSQSQPVTPAPAQPATPVVPTTPAAVAPVTPAYSSVQASSTFTPTVPEAFSETSTLNLPSELKTTEVAQSDLKGFELPLLSSFENKNHAALIYEGIKQLGTEQEETYDTTQLATELYQQLFELDITGTPEKLPEELTVGSLLYQKKKEKNVLLGVYIGDDYYLTVDDVEIEQETDKETNETSTEKTSKTSDTESEEKETQRQVVVESIDLEEDLLAQELPEATLTEYGEQTLVEYPAAMNFTENEGAKSFIEKVGEDARKLGQEYDVFASVMIAQALIESGSGTSSLSLAPNYNLFGIKGTYQGQSISMATQEDRGNGELYSINSAFRKYPNYAASLGDYVELLRGGISGNDSYYKQTWRSEAKNYLRTTNALTGTYATDTTYGQKLNSIIALYHLTEYDQVKIDAADSGIFIKGKDEIPEEYRSRMKYPDYNGVNYNSSGSYPVGQCTWYAFNRVKQLGKSVDDYMGNGGEWATKSKALGYEVSQKPKAGWLISFKPGVAGSDARYGHVAFVEVVRPEGILISEGNVYGGTVISYRVIANDLATSDQVSYIKAK